MRPWLQGAPRYLKYRGAPWSQILIFLSFWFYFVNPNRPIMLSHGRKAKVAPFETVVSMNYQQYTVPYSWLIMAPFKKRCLRRLHILVAHKKLVQTVPSFPFLFSINVSFWRRRLVSLMWHIRTVRRALTGMRVWCDSSESVLLVIYLQRF